MAQTLATAYVRMLPDFSDFGGDLRRGLRRQRDQKVQVQADVDTRGMDRKFSRQMDVTGRRGGKLLSGGMVAGLATLGAVTAGVGAGLGIVGIGLYKVTSKASDLNETISQTKVIFGQGAPAILAWSRTANRALGLTRNEALTAATGFGDLFSQLKVAPRQIQPMSTKLVGLASDLASFKNADITQVLEAQSAAFRGEYDSLQRFIPNINAARVETEALRQTHKKSAKDLTAAEKATAVYSIMLKDTTAAQGDFARTSNGMANQQRILKAQWEELQTTIGQKFLPIGVKLATWGNDKLIPFLSKAWHAASELGHGITMMWNAFQTGHTEDEGTKMERLGLFVRGVWEQVQKLVRWWKDDLNPALDKARKEILPDLIKFWNDVTKAFKGNDEEGHRLSTTIAAFGKFLTGFLIPALTQLVKYHLFQLRIAFVVIGTVLNKVVVPALRGLLIVAVNVLGGILTAATKTFGWIPGIGPKLKKAQKDFEIFKGQVNAALNGIKDRSVKVTATAVISGDTWRLKRSDGTLGPPMRKDGGSIHGPGGTRGDRIPTLLSDDEHVVSAREVKGAGGHGAIEAMRAHWRKRASGGRVGLRVDAAGDTGPMRAGVNRLNPALDHIGAEWGAQLRKDFSHLWDAPAVGGGGWSRMWSIVRNAIPGAILTSGFRPGAITATGNTSMHALGRAVDLGGPMRQIFEFLIGRYPESKEIIWSPGYGRQRYNGRPHMYGEPTRGDHWDHVHWGYDNGGWMPPGGRGINLSRKPEAVFSDAQWGILRQLVERGVGGPTIVLQNHGVITTHDAEDWLMDVKARLMGNGRWGR